MTAEILCVGTELLLGNIVNTNAAYIARALAELGIFTYYQSVVGDNPERLKTALELSLSRSDTVIITGGLGPTYDDLTKETVAALFGRRLTLHDESMRRLEEIFKRFGRDMTENNKKQAMMPEGCRVLTNNYGTAPGLAIEDGGKTVIMLPGPPREMEPMFREEVRPYLLEKSGQTLVSSIVNIFGMGESAVENILADYMKSSANPTIAPYAKEGEVELRVTALGRDENECRALIAPALDHIKSALGGVVYGTDAGSLQAACVAALRGRGLRLATAESCTGGYIGKRITEIAGSSEVYLGGVIAYDNGVKTKLLGVSEVTLAAHGAVSPEVAEEMARGAAEAAGADIAVSTTGIAGPGGGSEAKPVGLVYIGIYYRGETRSVRLNLNRSYRDSRENIRWIASSNALMEVIRTV